MTRSAVSLQSKYRVKGDLVIDWPIWRLYFLGVQRPFSRNLQIHFDIPDLSRVKHVSVVALINEISKMNLQRSRKAEMNPVHEKWGFQQIFAWAKHFEKCKLLRRLALSEHFCIFFRPCRGPLAARWRPLCDS